MSIQTTVQKEIEKMQNTIKREAAIENEVQNYTAVIEHIAEMKAAEERILTLQLMKSGKQMQKRD